MTPTKVLFIVQGEGRGHMTQAITLQNMLHDAGFSVCCVMIGKSSRRVIPEFVSRQIKAPLVTFESPNFVTDAKMKSIKIMPSVWASIKNMGVYRKSLQQIHEAVQVYEPDVIVNFFDPLAGIYALLYRPQAPMVCIAHQYIYLHPGFEFPEGKMIDRLAIKFYTRLTSLTATKKLALSFYPINNHHKRGIIATSPLLRKEVRDYPVENKGHLLVYLLNSGYMDDIIQWHRQHPEITVHCFTDKKDMAETMEYHPHLFFHQLDDKKFLDYMAGASALVCTAGFESVCEAMYLGKPVLMVPVQGHYEQFCNARDAMKASAGIHDITFNIDRLLDYLPRHKTNHTFFRQWVDAGSQRIVEEIEEVVNAKTTPLIWAV